MLLEKTEQEIANALQATVVGHYHGTLTGVASLQEAHTTDIAFLDNKKYYSQVLPSKAGIVLVPMDYDVAPPKGRAWILCEKPSEAFSTLVPLFTPTPISYPAGVHPSAIIAEDAKIGKEVHIGAGVVIEAKAEIGDHTILLPHCYIGHQTKIGQNCLLYPNVVIRERCILGNRIILHPGVVIGADGFGYKSSAAGHEKIPQVGIVQLEDDVEIGANSCVDRSRFGRTWIRRGTKIDNLVQIGHNVEIGENGMIVAQVGIAGSAHLGRFVTIAGQSGVSGHLKVGDGSIIMAQSGVTKDLQPGSIVFGMPAIDRKVYARQHANINKLTRTNETLKKLEIALEELKKEIQKKSSINANGNQSKHE
ncbi:MAG: UDP-3-O-(3-hydroxymyristoyl)glucosamine N-acyltransferase [Lentisphaeria bacterium]